VDDATGGTPGDGVPAVAWTRLTDIDPRQTEELLSGLRARGIPARAVPASYASGPWLEVRLPSRPLHRILVDGQRLTEARWVLTRLEHGQLAAPAGDAAAPGPPVDPSAALPDEAAELRRRFDAIVAEWSVSPEREHPWPAAEDLPEPPPAADPPPEGTPAAPLDAVVLRRAAPDPGRETAGPRAGDVGAADEDRTDDDEHYEPPPAPPVPRPSLATALAVLAIVVGVGLLAVPWSLGLDPSMAALFGVLCAGAGAGLLVSRMRDAPPDDDEDDGAVI
jgi:hypothetical protein